MKIKTGDQVLVIAGKDRNKIGKVVRTLESKNRVVVEGISKVTRHVRKAKNRPGEKVQFDAPIHISNVMILDPKTKKRTRIGYTVDKAGKKQRIAKKSKTLL